MDLLESRNGNLQHNAAFALYGLADNEDNIADIVRDGALTCIALGLSTAHICRSCSVPRCACQPSGPGGFGPSGISGMMTSG